LTYFVLVIYTGRYLLIVAVYIIAMHDWFGLSFCWFFWWARCRRQFIFSRV